MRKTYTRRAAPLPSVEISLEGTVPCCVPYWDSQEFFKAGGAFTQQFGYHIQAKQHEISLDFEGWLPRLYQWRGDPPGPVLLPDMLPASTWEANLRTSLSEPEWDRLRRFCYSAAGNTCVACGSRGEPHVEAHETWQFDLTTGIQRLKGLLCLCPTCHGTKHLGLAQRRGMLPQVLAKLRYLNGWTEAQLNLELEKLEVRLAELSQVNWKLDLSFLRQYGVR